MVMPNSYPGVCEVCACPVAPAAGVYLKVDGLQAVLCADHAPARPPLATIRVDLVGAQLQLRPAGFLGDALFAKFRSALEGSALFDRKTKANVAPLSALALVARRLTEAGFTLDYDVALEAAARALDDQKAAQTARAADRAQAVDAVLRTQGKHLMPFQHEGVAWLAPRAGAILADEMGLGKTIQVLVAAPAAAPLLVVCPKVAKGVWRAEAARWRPDLRVTVLEGRGSFRWPTAGELLILNYDILPPAPMTELALQAATARSAELGDGRRSNAMRALFTALTLPCGPATVLATTLMMCVLAVDLRELVDLGNRLAEDTRVRNLLASPPDHLVAVADEAHMLKGSTKKVDRAAAFRAIAEVAQSAGGSVWLVTGSPQLNDELMEIWNLLRIVGLTAEVFGTFDDFLRLAGAYRGEYGIVWGAAADVDPSVPERLSRAMLRRLKAAVLPQLPRKVIEVVDVDLDSLGKRDARELDGALAYLASVGVDSEDAARIMIRDKKIDFERLSRARAVLAKAKVPWALSLVEELEEAGEPALVLSAHREAVEAFASRPGWAVIHGDVSDEARTQIAAKFQAGELRGVAGTIQAMGVAITLTHGHEGIVIDPLPVPDLNRQAEDRLHRIGQENTVRLRYLRADHPVDRLFYGLCEVKRAVVAATVDAAAVTVAPAVAARVSDTLAIAPRHDGPAFSSRDEALDEVRRARAIRAARKAECATNAKRVRTSAEDARDRAVRANQSRKFGVSDVEFESAPRPARGTRELWAASAIQHLASVCDGAGKKDDQGFMKSDVALGHSLALQIGSNAGLTDGEWQVACRIAMRYPGQVGRPVEV